MRFKDQEPLQDLLVAFPCLARLFAKLPWEVVPPNVSKGFDPKEKETQRLGRLFHGGLIDPSRFEEVIVLETCPPATYVGGGYGAKENAIGKSGSTTYFLVNKGQLVPLGGGQRVRRQVAKRPESAFLFQIKVTEVIRQRADEPVKMMLLEFLPIKLPKAVSSKSDRRKDTGRHRRVA